MGCWKTLIRTPSLGPVSFSSSPNFTFFPSVCQATCIIFCSMRVSDLPGLEINFGWYILSWVHLMWISQKYGKSQSLKQMGRARLRGKERRKGEAIGYEQMCYANPARCKASAASGYWWNAAVTARQDIAAPNQVLCFAGLSHSRGLLPASAPTRAAPALAAMWGTALQWSLAREENPPTF